MMLMPKNAKAAGNAIMNSAVSAPNKIAAAIQSVGRFTPLGPITNFFDAVSRTGELIPGNMPDKPTADFDKAVNQLALTVDFADKGKSIGNITDPTTNPPGQIGDLMNYNPQSVQPDPALGLTVQDFNNFVDTYQPYSFDFSQDFAGLAGQSEGDTTPGAPDPNDPSQNSLSLEVSIMDPSIGLTDPDPNSPTPGDWGKGDEFGDTSPGDNSPSDGDMGGGAEDS